MHESSFSRRPTRVDRFAGAGHSGTVRSYYGTTHRGRDSGFDALPGFRQAEAGAGFPTVKLEVALDQAGYWNDLGWVQWVRQEFPEGRGNVGIVDRAPSMKNVDVPFAAFGYCPTFFDAPAWTSRPAVRWRAWAFLCTLPIMSRREPIVPLVGFEWGYDIAERGAEPDAHPLARASRQMWSSVRDELVARHRSWRFARDLSPSPRDSR